MATPIPYTPTYPYLGKQVIISSGRVTLHSKEDSVMLFGKKAIALSSLGTVNLDVTTKVLVNCPKIELGFDAEKTGQPVLLGGNTIYLIARLLNTIEEVGEALSQISETQLEEAIPKIVNSGKKLKSICPVLRSDLTSLLSQVTYTK